MSRDAVYEAFLTSQHEEGMALAGSSDVLDLHPLEQKPSSVWVARFSCKGIVRLEDGRFEEAECFEVGIRFPRDYLKRAEPMEVLTYLGPRNVWHPNISDRLPLICVGHLVPGTPLVDLLYQCFEIITYHKVTPREDDCLNPAACAWARDNVDRFPLDARPLKRPDLDIARHAGTEVEE